MNTVLNPQQLQAFINDGFVRMDHAFSADLATEARNILWKDLPMDPHDRTTWTQPVVRLGMYPQEPFIKAANGASLHGAFDQLVGKDRWIPCMSMGSFPVRFPSAIDAGDTGWHVDAGFPGEDPNDYFNWRINVQSKGRALLMLFLFSDVTEDDAPTRILKGSHLEVARLLEPAGEAGLSFMELAAQLSGFSEKDAVPATGSAGTVYLCHPFLVHGAQQHRGTEPKFMAQPPLLPKGSLRSKTRGSAYSPVEQAIQIALEPR